MLRTGLRTFVLRPAKESAHPSLPLLLEVEVVVAPASGIEHRATLGALFRTLEILPDGQFRPTGPAQDRTLVPFASRPHLDFVAGQGFVAVLTRIVCAAALHLDCDDIHWLVVVSATSLSVKTDSVNVGSRLGHTSLE